VEETGEESEEGSEEESEGNLEVSNYYQLYMLKALYFLMFWIILWV
jgi:hypothetical protein